MGIWFVGISEKDVNNEVYKILFIIIMSIVAGFIFLIFFMRWITKKFSTDVDAILDAIKRVEVGNLEKDCIVKSKDEIGDVGNSLQSLILSMREQTDMFEQISNGNLNLDVEVRSDKDVFSQSITRVDQSLTNLINELNQMTNEHASGHVEFRIDASKYEGAYGDVATGVNTMIEDYVTTLKDVITCLNSFGMGDFDATIPDYPGEKGKINEGIEAFRLNLQNVNYEISTLVDKSIKGNLQDRADTSKFKGDWNKLVLDINKLLESIIYPIKEAESVLSSMAKGNLDVRMVGNYDGDFKQVKDALNTMGEMINTSITDVSFVLGELANQNLDVEVTGNYKGDFIALKNSLDLIIDHFNNVLVEITSASNEVSAGASGMMSSSTSLSSGAIQQASAIEQISATVTEVAAQIQENASNAESVKDSAKQAENHAIDSNNKMTNLVNSMKDIQVAAENVQKVLKMIDDIAFQTNILSLNAAVEAARAGTHGKGFAVIAEDVRNLALKSSTAADDTSEMLDEIMHRINEASKYGEETADSLKYIVDSSKDSAKKSSDVAIASNEQASAINQITQSLDQISEVVQSTSNTARESLETSSELSNQSDQLITIVNKFRLKNEVSSIKKEFKVINEYVPVPTDDLIIDLSDDIF